MFRDVVNGEVNNVYSKADYILHLYSLSSQVLNPIGRSPIDLPHVNNFDITKNVISDHLNGVGHTNYMEMSTLLEICANI